MRPRLSLLLWVIVMTSWHIPAVYDFAVEHETVHDLEHLSFAIVGILVWVQLVDPTLRGGLRVHSMRARALQPAPARHPASQLETVPDKNRPVGLE